MLILQSDVVFSGTMNISRNTGGLGGGMRIVGRKSHVLFKGDTIFEDNIAGSGGAIYSFYETTFVLFFCLVLPSCLYAIGLKCTVVQYLL